MSELGPAFALDQYPVDVRNWLDAKGGAERMPQRGYWTMPASELWQMGYRRCGA